MISSLEMQKRGRLWHLAGIIIKNTLYVTEKMCTPVTLFQEILLLNIKVKMTINLVR